MRGLGEQAAKRQQGVTDVVLVSESARLLTASLICTDFCASEYVFKLDSLTSPCGGKVRRKDMITYRRYPNTFKYAPNVLRAGS